MGIGIAHSGFHKHGAYIVENADMPGFSRRDQSRLAALVRASRGGLDKLGLPADDPNWPLILCLRLAVLFCISRDDGAPAGLRLECSGADCRLRLPPDWLKANPLSKAVLEDEVAEWAKAGPAIRLV